MKKRIFICALAFCLLVPLCGGCGSRSFVGAWKGDASKTLADTYNIRTGQGDPVKLSVEFMIILYEDGTGKLVDNGFAVDLKWSVDEEGLLRFTGFGTSTFTCTYEFSGSSLILTPLDTELPIAMRRATPQEKETAENIRSWAG
ncbi:MAG: hypothetical protein ACOX17_08920 [Christensenellales bacterium]